MSHDSEKEITQGSEILATIQAPTEERLDEMLGGLNSYAEENGLETVRVLERGEDPDGGYRAVISAHNWNPFEWGGEAIGAGAEGIVGVERGTGRTVEAASGALGGVIKPYEKEEKITWGDRITYRVGIVERDGRWRDAWRVVKSPYKNVDDTELAVGAAPLDAKRVEGVGAAYKEVERLTKEAPVDLFMKLDELDEYDGVIEHKGGLPKLPPQKTKPKQSRNLASAVGFGEVR